MSYYPNSPPPRVKPSYYTLWGNIESETLEPYLFMHIYIWLKNGISFWMVPEEINIKIISGFAWNGKTWIRVKFNIKYIRGFY